jgi:hypothetical protein
LPDSLKWIGISKNPLEEIDLKNKLMLQSLHVDGTLLKKVDCSDCKKIAYLGCDKILTLKEIILPTSPTISFSLRKDSNVQLSNIPKDFVYKYDEMDTRHIFTKIPPKKVKSPFDYPEGPPEVIETIRQKN